MHIKNITPKTTRYFEIRVDNCELQTIIEALEYTSSVANLEAKYKQKQLIIYNSLYKALNG